MLTKIMGTIWVILGILWTAKPDILKNRVKKKISRRIKWVVLGFVFVFGFSLAGGIMRAPGLILKIIALAALIAAIKFILFASSASSEKIWAWWQERSLIFFRIAGAFVLAAGLILVLLPSS